MNTPPQSIPAAEFKPRFDTSTTAGKIAVMQEAERVGYVYAKAQHSYSRQPLEITCWDWAVNQNSYNFPAEPKRTLVPWTKDTVPREAWIRTVAVDTARGYEERPITAIDYSCLLVGSNWITYKDASISLEHSLDGGKTWLPCGTWKEEV